VSLTEQLKESIDNLNSGQKTSLVVFFMLVFGLLIAVIVWAGSDNYTTVLRSSDLSRVRAASSALDDAGIDHKISSDGTAIETARTNVGKARIISTGSGSISGMEALGSIELGSSPQHERWVYMNLLQGELTRTINALDEVTACRVHIVEPDESPFMNRNSKGSASVTIQLEPGTNLSALQVRGITHLVAGAVKGLSPKDVVLVDDSGKLLSGARQDEEDGMAGGGSSTLFELKYKYESQFRKKLIELLGQVMGSIQQVSTTVNVELNTEAVEKNSTQLLPESQVTISERLNEASTKESNPQGIPGAESNLPEQAPPAEEGNGQSKFQSSANYDYTRVSEREIKPAGSIKSVTVAIMIDLATAEQLVANATDKTLESLREDIEAAAKNTVGFQDGRDDVKVSFVPFANLTQEAVGVSSDGLSWVNESRNVIVMILALLIIYFGIIRPFVQSITTSIQQDQNQNNYDRRALDDGGSVGDLDRLQLLARDFTTADKNELNNLVERFEQPSAEVLKRWIRTS
jgi:flagellar M-ring protein FliF